MPVLRQPVLTGDMKNLDLLRAVAVSCVFFAHFFQYLIKASYIHPQPAWLWDVLLNEIGHIGVLFFFVHTALVLMLSMDRMPAHRLIGAFYIRRFFRIYPLSIVCIIAVLVFHVPQVPEATFVAFDWKEIISNLLLVQNVTKKADVIMVLWTLTREVQMYLVLPLLYFALKKLPSSLFVLILWLASFAAVDKAPLLSCVPCFMGGVFAYQLAKEKTGRLRSAIWPLAIAGLLILHVLLALTVLPDYRNDYILCMFLGAVIPNVADLPKSMITRASQEVAKYSYGIYLFHTPLIWFSFVQLGKFPVGVRWAAFVVSMIAVPVCAHRWIEMPLIDKGRRVAASWATRKQEGATLTAADSAIAS